MTTYWAASTAPGGRMIFISLCNPTAGTNPFNLYIVSGAPDAGPDIFNPPGGHFLRCTE